MKMLKRIGGYLLLFILSLVPAGIALRYEAGANEIGMIYLGTIIWAILFWFALRIIESSEDII
ncbi:MAG: hypothetical protein KAT18_07765 [Candidatus Latescibacteria bacterium]|nr:hypothetical protein [Candidatus Latescibacterota bacterium]